MKGTGWIPRQGGRCWGRRKVISGDSFDKGIARGNKGSWQAHMNALQRAVEKIMTSALILEDDADWDVRLKYQLQVYAQAARAFTQPQSSGSSLARAEFWRPNVNGDNYEFGFFLSELPSDLQPKLIPYGITGMFSGWDTAGPSFRRSRR